MLKEIKYILKHPVQSVLILGTITGIIPGMICGLLECLLGM